jgi:hypothetical protein
MLAESRPFIIGSEQTAGLKDRDHPVYEQVELSRQWLENNEAICCAAFEPLLQPIRHSFGRSYEGVARGRKRFGHLPQSQIFRAYFGEDATRTALLSIRASAGRSG